MQKEFEQQLGILDDADSKLLSDDIYFWLNKSQEDLVLNFKENFENTRNMTDDLRTLAKIGELPPVLHSDGSARYQIDSTSIRTKEGSPFNYIYYLSGEIEVQIGDKKGLMECLWSRHSEAISQKSDPFNKQTIPITIGDKYIFSYKANLPVSAKYGTLFLTAICRPAPIERTAICELPLQRHRELVTNAVGMYLASLPQPSKPSTSN